MENRVVVTGLGTLSGFGLGMDVLWDGLMAGRSCVDRITKFDTEGFSSTIASEVRNFDPESFMEPKEAKRTDPFIQFAVAAATLAVQDSGLDTDQVDADRFGVYIGSGIGGITEIAKQQIVLQEKGPRRVSPFFIPNAIANLSSGHVSIKFNARGPNSSVCTACATGTHSLGDAYWIIRRGDADIMIAGGAESSVMPLAVAGFCSMKALSTRNEDPKGASRPFDLDRDGFVIGEGSACLILESEEHARRRGARIYCELAGYGMTGDAYHLSHPAPDGHGAVRCMQAAMKCAGIKPGAIDFINAHGTSTPLNDKYETLAIKSVFGEFASKIPINSTKSMVGHLLGAAGALEMAVVARSIFEGRVHRTLNYTTPDPDCDLDYIPEGNREIDISYALSNSFGFGGTNASIVAAKYRR